MGRHSSKGRNRNANYRRTRARAMHTEMFRRPGPHVCESCLLGWTADKVRTVAGITVCTLCEQVLIGIFSLYN